MLLWIKGDRNEKIQLQLWASFFLCSSSLAISANEVANYSFRILKDINSGPSNALVDTRGNRLFDRRSSVSATNNKLIFLANNGLNGTELWGSDGTNASTKLLKDIEVINDNLDISDKAVCDNFMIFKSRGNTQDNKESIWVSDGTTEGTRPIFFTPTPGNAISQFITRVC